MYPSQEADPDNGTWVVIEQANIRACLRRRYLLLGTISTFQGARMALLSHRLRCGRQIQVPPWWCCFASSFFGWCSGWGYFSLDFCRVVLLCLLLLRVVFWVGLLFPCLLLGGAAWHTPPLGGVVFPTFAFCRLPFPPLGGAAFTSSSVGWCCFASSFFGWCSEWSAAFPLSSVGWCCLAHSFLGGVVVFPSPVRWCCSLSLGGVAFPLLSRGAAWFLPSLGGLSCLVALPSFSSFGRGCFFPCLLLGGAAWSLPSMGGVAVFLSCSVVLPSFSSSGRGCFFPCLLLGGSAWSPLPFGWCCCLPGKAPQPTLGGVAFLPPSLGGAVFPSPFACCCLPSPPLGGAVFPSPFACCCLPSPPLGGAALSSSSVGWL